MSTCLTDFECVKSSQVKSSQVKSSQVKSSEGESEAGTKCGQLPGQSFSSITSPNAAVPRPTLHRLRVTSQMASTSRAEQFRRWAAVRQRDGNDRCAECESRDTSWVVLNCAQPPPRPTLAMRVEEAV